MMNIDDTGTETETDQDNQDSVEPEPPLTKSDFVKMGMIFPSFDIYAMADVGIPERYARAIPAQITALTADGGPLREEIKQYVHSLDENLKHGLGMVLIGPGGTGKTSALTLALRCAFERWPESCLYLPAHSLVDHTINRTPFRGSNDDLTIIEQARRCCWLLIDDVGLGRVDARFLMEFERLIRIRYDSMLPTLITSTVHDLLDGALPASTASVIREVSDVIHVRGKDLRSDLEFVGGGI